MRPFCLAAALVLMAPAALAADLALPRAAPGANVLVCPDTYCGQRKYPDPWIADGWRGSDPRYDMNLDVRTWHRLRTMTPVYIGAHPDIDPEFYP